MRIPLDYYRILGLPSQATAEQLQQAHRDRTLQLPRREFSEVAIETRRQLIDQAYSVLSEPSQRQEYDANFLSKSYELAEIGRSPEITSDSEAFDDSHSLGSSDYDDSYAFIDIAPEQLVGALLILLDLGEYELVLKYSAPYLNGNNFALKQGQFGEPEIVAADIVLTHALACLELGREQWQQGQYESAAESLQAGQEVLLRAGLFPGLRGEMQSDLYKLRPYRILELVALPEYQEAARQQGLSLLQDMLNDRQGIDGNGDDQSGLAIDDFLRFIQQLRSYLTAAEQQTLFESEARRPSAVAVYLSVYALLARGFADRQPALIRRAKTMLLRLSTRQDVHLEQSICSLLLGQTEEATRALDLSQEFDSIAFIREHSQGSPDLLPGLCLYSERWLQNEVFPHFRDLVRKQASLKEYFADEDVQSYLEELPSDPEPVSPWSSRRSLAYGSSAYDRVPSVQPLGQRTGSLLSSPPTNRYGTEVNPVDRPHLNGSGLTSAESMVPFSEPSLAEGAVPPTPPLHRSRRGHASGGAPVTRRVGGQLRLDRLFLLGAIGIGLLFLGYLLTRLLTRSAPSIEGTVEEVQPLAPVLATVMEPQGQASTVGATLNETSAASVIEAWLSAKAEALGETYATDRLADVLAEPALSEWQTRAEQLEASNSYWQYEHSPVEVSSVEPILGETATTQSDGSDVDDTATGSGASAADSSNTESAVNTAIVQATVTERGDFYNNGQLDESSSYESTLEIEYTLIREGNQWRIQDWQVLE